MKILVLGGGAREHALCWRLSMEKDVELLCGPGNAGTAEVARNVDLNPMQVASVVAFAKAEKVDFVVVGPEAPLDAGVVDELDDAGILAFGPSQAAAELESSKVFSKRFMRRHGVPTAAFEVFSSPVDAEAYVREANRPLVIKADGLAAGKGVVVAKTAEEALAAIHRIMRDRDFGEAGSEIVIEECLSGPELSFHIIASGERYMPLATAQDHKRLRDGDEGPNTGGMGAYSPTPVVDAALEEKIRTSIVEPTLKGLAQEGRPFRGTLFLGIMMHEGEPQLLEYNVRFGDPECEVLMARWGGSLLPLLQSAATDGALVHPDSASWAAPHALCVVLASGGYPGAYEKGVPIQGLEEAQDVEGVQVFHAGTRREKKAVVTAGGRVLTVTAVGSSLQEAQKRAYQAADCISFEGKQFRKDIAKLALVG